MSCTMQTSHLVPRTHSLVYTARAVSVYYMGSVFEAALDFDWRLPWSFDHHIRHDLPGK